MLFIKTLIILLIVINLNAMQKDIIYVEDINSNYPSLKDEFLNSDTKYYTLTIATLKSDGYDIIEFFKRFKLKNAIAYKYGANKEYIKIISGIYENGTLASEDIKNLDIELQKNKPYSSKLFRHHKKFNSIKKEIVKTTINKNRKNLKKIDLKGSKNSVFIQDTKEAQELKKEFFNKNSKYYSIALGSIPLSKTSIKNFFETYEIGDKALAHLYGKNRDKVRVIYGLYKSREDAQKAIKSFNQKLKSNSPFSMKMSKFQSFYSKNFLNKLENSPIIELKINDKKQNEQVEVPKLSDEIKIVKSNPKIKAEAKVEKKEIKSEVKKDKNVVSKPKRKIVKKVSSKKIKEENLNKNKFIKASKLEDVYFIESNGNFNILSEVFLNNGSSFYTVDLGELKLEDVSIEQFFVQNSMKDNALAYKYGDKKEFARVVYGAYETKEAAQEASKKLNISNKKTRISNIKNHQKLYKEFHKNQKVIKSSSYYEGSDDIIYLKLDNKQNKLKEEFFNYASSFYTITLTTFLKDSIDIENYFSKNNLSRNSLAFSIGSDNNYYRVIHGVYRTYDEAKSAIEDLNYKLRKNSPYVSRIRTQQKKFESYNNRVLEEEKSKAIKIEFSEK